MARGRNFAPNTQRRPATPRARQRGRGRVTGLGGPSPMPWDSRAQRESGELGNEAADTRASLAARYAAAQNDLGFGSGASNPYSKSAENKTNLTNDQRGVANTAGNQLYAGSTLNAQSQARGQYDKSQKQIEEAIAEAQNANTSGTAKTGRDEALGQNAIREGAIGRAAASEPQPLAVGSGRKGAVSGRGRVGGPGRDGRNVRRPGQARTMNAQARAINARVNSRNRGRGRV